MTIAQRRILNRRFHEASVQQPDLKALRRLLLCLGGTHLVPPPGPEEDLSLLIEGGFAMDGPVVRTSMQRGEAHGNVAQIWAERQRSLVGIGTGYALSQDGLWRQHSWGILHGGILETTVLRIKYFGILLQDRNADYFAIANLRVDTCPLA